MFGENKDLNFVFLGLRNKTFFEYKLSIINFIKIIFKTALPLIIIFLKVYANNNF